MDTGENNISSEELERMLEDKLQEYNTAEQQQKGHEELSTIYKQIKDIQYQLTIRNTGEPQNGA